MNYYRIIDILMVLFSIQIIRMYLNAFCWKKKRLHKKRWIIWLIYIIFQIWVMISSASFPLFNLVMNILLVFLICYLSYKIDIRLALFLAGMLYVVWMLVEVATNYVLGMTGIILLDSGFIVGVIISKIVMYILLHVINRYTRADFMAELPFKYWARLFIVPIVTIYIIHNSYQLTINKERSIFFLISTALLILINYMIFDVYNRLGKQIVTDRKMLVYEQQLELCEKQGAEREAAYQETRRLRHNLKEYLIDLKAAVEVEDLEGAKRKIEALLEKNQIYHDEIVHSGNLVVDALLNYKYSSAKQQGISVKSSVEIPEEMPFDGGDLCVILGNLLDNSIEAAIQLPESYKYIKVNIRYIKSCLAIVVENSCAGTAMKERSGRLLTTKMDKREHGLGLESVKYTVEKYNGEMVIEQKDYVFIVKALLYSY